MNKSIRFVSVLAISAMAVASQAVNVYLSSSRDSGVATPPQSFTENLDTNNSQSPFSAFLMNSVVNVNFTGGANSTATYTSSTGNVTFSFNGTQVSTGTGVQGFLSGASITSATGSFSPYLGFSGLLATSNTNLQTGSNTLTISGNLTPTPEPASFAALGVGALALLRRRRKA